MKIGNTFQKAAHDLVAESLNDAAKGNYAESWAKMPLARYHYLIDTIQCIVTVPFVLLETLFAAVEAIATWGYQMDNLKACSSQLLDQTNRVFVGFLGLVISPTWAYHLRFTNVLSSIFLGMAAVAPNDLHYIPGHGFAYGWRLGR